MKKKTVFAIMAALVTAFIFWNSAQPAVESAKSSGVLSQFSLNILTQFGININFDLMDVIIRKTAHITEFFVQAVFIANSFSGRYRKRIIYILLLGLLTACTDEFIQLFVDGRSGEVTDIFIDFFGTVSGMAICGLFGRKRHTR